MARDVYTSHRITLTRAALERATRSLRDSGCAAAIVPDGNGYEAALVNFRFMASAVWTTEEATKAITQK